METISDCSLYYQRGVEEDSLKFLCTQMDLADSNAVVETPEDVEKRFKKWDFVLNSVNKRVHKVVKQFQINEERLSAEMENVRNGMNLMKAEFSARDAAKTAEIMAAHEANIRLEKQTTECTEALHQVYERLMGASALIQPVIQSSAGAADEVYELSSEDDVHANESVVANASSQSREMEPNAEMTAPAAIQRHFQHHVPLKAEPMPAPSEHSIGLQIDDGQENSIELDKENSDPRSEELAMGNASSTPIAEKRKQKQPKLQHAFCNMCDAIFKKKKSLMEHQISFHSVNRKYFQTGLKRKVTSEDDDDIAGRFVSAQSKRKRPM